MEVPADSTPMALFINQFVRVEEQVIQADPLLVQVEHGLLPIEVILVIY